MSDTADTDNTGVKKHEDNAYGLIAAIFAMIAVIVLIIYGTAKLVPFLRSESSDIDRQIAYIKDDVLYYVKDMTASDPRPMPVDKISGEFAFSGDGRYIYFLDRTKLKRILTSSIRYDENINKECIENVLDGVKKFSFPFDEYPGYALIETAKSELVLFDGKNTVVIAKNCTDHRISKNGVRIFYATSKGDVGFYNIRKKNPVVLATGVDLWELNAGDMYYTVAGENGTDIYMIDVSEEKTKLIVSGCDHLAGVGAESGEICYVTKEKRSMSFYDMVDDIWTDADYEAALSIGGYLSADTYSVFDVMNEKDRRYYKNHPKKLEDFYKKLPAASEVTGLSGDYILYRKNGDECFVCKAGEKSWHKLDTASAEAALCRVQMKEALSSEEFSYNVYSFEVKTKGGDIKIRTESVAPEYIRYVCDGLVLYRQAFMPGRISMDDVDDVDEVCNYYDGYEYDVGDDIMYASASGGMKLDIEGDSFYAQKNPNSEDLVLYTYTGESGKQNFEGAYYLTIEDGSVTHTGTRFNCSGMGAWCEDGFLYFSNMSLYMIHEGRYKPVFTDVYTPVYRYEYGPYLVTKGTTDDDKGLFLVTAGEEWIEIAEYVSPGSSTLVYDDQIVYLCDGELYVYLGSDHAPAHIASDVREYTCFGIKPECVIKDGFF